MSVRRLSFVFAACIASIILAADKPKPKKPARIEKHQPDPEDRWICRIGSYHNCHCPAMVAAAAEAGSKHCADTSLTHEAYIKCLGELPTSCDVIQKLDDKHPENSCKRTCKTMAGCQCNDDGPKCEGPIVWHQLEYDGSEDQH